MALFSHRLSSGAAVLAVLVASAWMILHMHSPDTKPSPPPKPSVTATEQPLPVPTDGKEVEGGTTVERKGQESLGEPKLVWPSASASPPTKERGPTWARHRYPGRIVTELPGGVAPVKFVKDAIREIAALQGGREGNDRRLNLEDLLAQAAMGMPEVKNGLMELARGGDPKERELAITLLGRLPDSEAVKFLRTEALSSSDPKTRLASIWALAQDQGWNVENLWGDPNRSTTSHHPGPIADPATAEALVEQVRRESDPEVLKSLLNMQKYLLQELVLEDEEDRSAHPQGMHFGDASLSALTEVALHHSDAEIRSRALGVITASDNPSAGQFLVRAATDSPTEEERANAIRALRTCQATIPERPLVIVQALENRSDAIRLAAAQAATSTWRDEVTFRKLVDVFRNDPAPSVRVDAWRSAVLNLQWTKTADNSPANPDYGRALDLIEEGLTKSTPGKTGYSSYARELLERIESGSSGTLSPSQSEQLKRLKKLVGKP